MTTRIGTILRRGGFVTEAEVQQARRERLRRIRENTRGEQRLGEILVELGIISRKTLLWALDEQKRVRSSQKGYERSLDTASLALEEMRTAALCT